MQVIIGRNEMNKTTKQIIDCARDLLNLHNLEGQPKLDTYLRGYESMDACLRNLHKAFADYANEYDEETE